MITKLDAGKEIGTYFVTPSGQLYYIDGVTGAWPQTYIIENCKTNQFVMWTEGHLISRRSKVVVPLAEKEVN